VFAKYVVTASRWGRSLTRFTFVAPKFGLGSNKAGSDFYKHHLQDLLKRRIPNHSLFEAYVQYCFSPKHTTGEQLLEVRRDKREREAFAALHDESEEDEYENLEA
jgi:hypothetical protein